MKNAYTIDENGFEVKVPHSEKLNEHDYEPMVEADYRFRVEVAKAKGKDPSNIRRRTPDQIFNSLNRSYQRKHQAFYKTKIKSEYGTKQEIKVFQPVASMEVDNDIPQDMDNLGEHSADYTSEREIEDWIETVSIKQTLILGGLEPERVDLLIRCDVTRDKRKNEIASELGIDPQSLTMRLQRTRTQAKRILRKQLDSSSPAAKEKQEVKR